MIRGAIRKMRPPPGAADRTIALTVVDRQVVAHDQDVVALTLVAADGRPLPRWHPGAHLDVHLPSGRLRQYSLCGDPDDADALPHRGAPDPRRRRRIRSRCTRAAGRCDGDDARTPQRVPADRSRLRLPDPAVPLHRRRHRNHADPADAGPRRASRRGLVDGVRRPQPRQPAVHRRGRAGSAIGSRSAPTTSSGVPTATELLGELPRRHHGVRVRARADVDRDPRPSWPDATTSSSISNASPRRPSSTAGSSRCRSRRPARQSWSAPTRRC